MSPVGSQPVDVSRDVRQPPGTVPLGFPTLILPSVPTVNVQGAGFNAKGNGTDDDTKAIEQAFRAALAWQAFLGGESRVRVSLPLGVYKITNGFSAALGTLGNKLIIEGPGELLGVGDFKVFNIQNLSDILFSEFTVNAQQAGGGAVGNTFELDGGATRIRFEGLKILLSQITAIKIGAASDVRIIDTRIEDAAEHGVMSINGASQIHCERVYVYRSGNSALGGASGKGIATAATNGNVVDRVNVIDCYAEDCRHVSFEFWSDDLANSETRRSHMRGSRVKQTLVGANTICFSIAGSRDCVQQNCEADGGTIQFEIAYSKRCGIENCNGRNASGLGVSVSRSTGGLTTAPEGCSIKGVKILAPSNHALQFFGAAPGCNDMLVEDFYADGTGGGATARGIFWNNVGSINSILRNIRVVNFAKSGVYLLDAFDVIMDGIISKNNNTTADANERDIYLNMSAGNVDRVYMSGFLFGTFDRPGGIGADSQSQALAIGGFVHKFTAAVTNVATNFAHGLPYTPRKILLTPQGNILAWQSGASSSVNVNLQGSVAGPVNVDVYVA